MNPSALFIRRPVATILLTVAVAFAGGIAYKVLPVSPLPQVDFPTISVGASLPGASAEIMASSVATPLERQLGHIAGVTEMTSSNSLGTTGITIQFDLSRNIDGAARDVQAAINAARTYLPANLPGNPTYRKVNPADAPIMILGLTSHKFGPAKLYDEASTVIQQKLSQIKGVGQVSVGGGALPSVRVEMNPTKLASFGLSMSNVQSVLSVQNADGPKGQLTQGDSTIDILANDQISKAEDYKPLVIGYHNGAAVKLSDVAEVNDSVQNLRAGGYLNGERAVTIIVFRQPGANIIETVDRLVAAMDSVRASIPTGIDIHIVLNRTTTIRASVADVQWTLLISVLLVVVVVFVFLRNWRATVIPGIAVPVSLIGTCAVMYLFGYSIDNLSLMALTIATGFVVDDAIVVMENVSRHLEEGLSPMQAALKGAQEIGFTVFSISVSLIAVFIPLLMMGGIVGRLFREFAITLSTAIVVSMVISLTTTPMMCAYLLKDESHKKHGRLYNATERAFDLLLAGYKHSLVWFLENSGITLVILAFTILLNFLLVFKMPKGFFPLQDTGSLSGSVQGPQDSSYAAMNYSIRQLGKVLDREPSIANAIMFTGGNGATNTGNMYITLKPLADTGYLTRFIKFLKGEKTTYTKQSPDREMSASDVVNKVRPQLNALPVASVFLQPSQDLRIGGRSSAALYQYTLQSDSAKDLIKWGPVVLKEMERLPGLVDVNTDQQNGGLDELITFDRQSAAKLGITTSALDSALYSSFGQSEVSVIYTQLNQYYVVLEVGGTIPENQDNFIPKINPQDHSLGNGGSAAAHGSTRGWDRLSRPPRFWETPEALKFTYLTASNGRHIPFYAVATSKANTIPLAITHTGLFPSVTMSFNLAPKVSMSEATERITDMKDKLGMPGTMQAFFAGTAQAYQASLSSEPILIGTALLAVYIVLGILYESLVHPITIISTVFSASVGAMLALKVFGEDLNVISVIGIVLLIGIVKKNAIMMIDFALEAERKEGKGPADAIFEACMLRFRPIMMTTLAALFGALPLALGTGTGSELRRPLGISIVGGLIVSQMLTLYSTPVVYLAFDRLRLLVQGKQHDVFHHGEPDTNHAHE